MVEFSSADGAVIVGVEELEDGILKADLLWLDAYTPEVVAFPGVGLVVIPDRAVYKPSTLLIVDIELSISETGESASL